MSRNINYNYAFVFYDIAEKRVNKVFKVCKKYFKHHQKSVFRGNITPSNLIQFREEIKKVIKKDEDYITIIKLISKASFEEENLGRNKSANESLII
jgi:CRISPR-associated protein Cas2